MNGFLWAALGFASVGVIVAIGMATIASRSATHPDGWAALGSAFILLCILVGIAILLAAAGLLAKVL